MDHVRLYDKISKLSDVLLESTQYWEKKILDTQTQILTVELGCARMFIHRQGRSNKPVIKRKASRSKGVYSQTLSEIKGSTKPRSKLEERNHSEVTSDSTGIRKNKN